MEYRNCEFGITVRKISANELDSKRRGLTRD